MKDVLQNTARGFWVLADDASAIGTGMTGLTITAEISKGGAAFATVAPTITERGEGLYWVVPIAAHRDTLGETAWRFAATGAIIAPRVENVVAYDAQLVAVGAAVSTDIVSAADIRTELAVELGRIDENTSAPKTLTAATLATLFDDSDASQQLTDFFAGLIARFDDAADIPVTTVAATTIAQLFAHTSMIELLADAEAARAAAVTAATNALSSANIRSAIGMSAANLDTQLSSIPNSTQIADTVLSRAVQNVEDTADKHSLGAVILLSTNSTRSQNAIVANKPSDDSLFHSYAITTSDVASMTGIS